MTAGVARAFWMVRPGVGEVRDEPLPALGADQVLVRTLYSGISAGTERLVFRGAVPESQYSTMRAPFQTGDFPGPLKYGYAAVGRVEEGPDTLRGRAVFCLYPHQSAFVVPVAAVRPVPEPVPLERAVLAANMETALNAVWDAAVLPGERVVVVGAGVVGLLVAHRLDAEGRTPLVVDTDLARADVASDLGLPCRLPSDVEGPFDVAIHASGSGAGLIWAMERLGFEGRAIELSWYGEARVSLPLGEAFHARRLTLVSSQVGSIARPMRGRIDHAGRLDLALRMLDDPRLDRLIDEKLPLATMPAFMEALAAGRRVVLCAAVEYG
ncbi:MAG: zinc-binding alcohol dehydrogenase [Pseudomonadota bacterium]